jgi:hypothetical protein
VARPEKERKKKQKKNDCHSRAITTCLAIEVIARSSNSF